MQSLGGVLRGVSPFVVVESPGGGVQSQSPLAFPPFSVRQMKRISLPKALELVSVLLPHLPQFPVAISSTPYQTFATIVCDGEVFSCAQFPSIV